MERRTGKTLAMLEGAAEYLRQHPTERAMVVVHASPFIGYCKALAQHAGIEPEVLARFDFLPAARATERSRGRRGARFVDHFVWSLKPHERAGL